MTAPHGTSTPPAPTALVTGASAGLGRALTAALVARGWRVVVDARRPAPLHTAWDHLDGPGTVEVITGDVSDPAHRRELVAAVTASSPDGGLSLLVNNASVLGPIPRPALAHFPLSELERVFAVNTFAPLALTVALRSHLQRRGGTVLNVSSDAAVESYPWWGGYGASKAALDHLSATLAAEHPDLHVSAFDPGDMATDLQQQAFPGEDVSDRADPADVVPAVLHLLDTRPPSGRYRATDLLDTTAVTR
jgi:NAD(P)-dependent dehydrogenase (short-subunit alcohol dehydrogenase family)